MNITFNKTFKRLYKEYQLSDEIISSTKVSDDLQRMIDRRIFIKKDRIFVPPLGQIFTVADNTRNLSEIEDFNNHFHVAYYAKPKNNKATFMLAIKALTLLANKFDKRKIEGIRFWLTFETKEMSEHWSKANNLHERGDKYNINERLTFYKRRDNEHIIEIDEKYTTTAIFIIDT